MAITFLQSGIFQEIMLQGATKVVPRSNCGNFKNLKTINFSCLKKLMIIFFPNLPKNKTLFVYQNECCKEHTYFSLGC
jgi:hypothetical protein